MTGAHRILAACALAGTLVSVGAARSQPPPPSGAAQQPDLNVLLHLRPDQQTAFQAYQSAIRPSPDEVSQARQASPQALSTLTTPERLDRIGSLLTLQQRVFMRRAAATRAFYTQLTPDQQSTFDRVSAPNAQRPRAAPQG